MISGLFFRPRPLGKVMALQPLTIATNQVYNQQTIYLDPGRYIVTVSGGRGGGGGMDTFYPNNPGQYGQGPIGYSTTKFYEFQPKVIAGAGGIGGITNASSPTKGGDGNATTLYTTSGTFDLESPGGAGGIPGGIGVTNNNPFGNTFSGGNGAYYTGSVFIAAQSGQNGKVTFTLIG